MALADRQAAVDQHVGAGHERAVLARQIGDGIGDVVGLAAARDRLRPLLEAEALTVSALNAALGITRRHGVPLLERLDADGFTRREGDRRVLQPLGRR